MNTAAMHIPEHFRENPGAYDLWQAYTMLAGRGEAWRFGFPASLAFPVSEVEGLCFEDDGDGGLDARLDVNLSDSPLPLHLVEMIIQERHEGNRALQDFFDLLQNRLMRLWMEEAEAMCPELGRGADGEAVAPPEERVARAGWVDFPEEYRTRLGRVNARLGEEAILGKTVFEPFL